jgi:hypothetical protein
MGDMLRPGALVRYARNGPAGAMRGCIGQVVEPNAKATERGWTRVKFAGIVGNYDSQFLQRPDYVTATPYESGRVWNSWRDAVSELCQMIEAHYDSHKEGAEWQSDNPGWNDGGPDLPALWNEAESAMSAVKAASETVSGISVSYAGADYSIAVQ